MGRDYGSEETPAQLTLITGKVIADSATLNSSLRAVAEPVPVASAQVWLNDLPFFPPVFTDDLGNFSFSNVPPGNHRVVASFTSRLTGKPLKIRSFLQTITPAQVNNVQDLQLLPANNQISGIIRDKDGNPLPAGTKIVIWGEIVTLGAGGTFTSPPMPSGENLAEISVLLDSNQDPSSDSSPASTTVTIPLIQSGEPVSIDITIDHEGNQVPGNQNRPAVLTISASKNGTKTTTAGIGTTLSLLATAVDPDTQDQSGPFVITWTLNQGQQGQIDVDQQNKLVATFTAPWVSGTAAINLTVTDPRGATSRITMQISVTGQLQAVSPDAVLLNDVYARPGTEISITSAGNANVTLWLAPANTTVFNESNTMTRASGNASSIVTPSSSGEYKLFVMDIAGNISNASTKTVIVDGTAPNNQNNVLSASRKIKPSSDLAINSSGNTLNTVWVAPAGTTVFAESPTMTRAAGDATNITTPSATGIYHIYVVDAAGNVSQASTATVTVDNSAPVIASSIPAAGEGNVSATADIQLTFSETIVAGTGNIYIKKDNDDTIFQTIPVTDSNLVSINNNIVTITHDSLSLGTRYYLTIDNTCFLDSAENSFAGISSKMVLSFVTKAGFSVSETLVTTESVDNTGVYACDVTPDGQFVYVLGSNSRLYKFDAAGNLITSVGGASGDDSNLSIPFDVAYDPVGEHVYVANYGGGSIKVFDKDLNFVANIASARAWRLCVAGGYLYVVKHRAGGPSHDLEKRQLYSDSATLNIDTSVTITHSDTPNLGEMAYPQDVAVDNDGNIYVTDSIDNFGNLNGFIVKFDSSLAIVSRIEIGGPRAIAFNGGFMFVGVTIGNPHKISKLDMSGNLIEQYSGVNFPGSIVFDSNNNMLVSNVNGTYKITKYQRNY